jgi:imidazolonepropionase-like amidohydrolase
VKRLLVLLLALAASPVAAQTLAITNGKVAIGDGSPPIDGGTVLIRGGRIVAAGRDVRVPPDARRVDAGGKWVTPGIVAGFTQVGLGEVDQVDQVNDTVAGGSPFSAGIDIAPAVNAASSMIAVTRSRGVTRALVAPSTGRTIFAGQGAWVDTAEDREAVFAPRAFQFVEFGEAGAGKAGGSRAATFAAFRNAMLEARDYARNPAGYEGGRDTDSLLMRVDAAALVPVLNGRMPLLVRVSRAADIIEVLRLQREFPSIRLVLVGANEGWLVADRIAAAGVPVLVSALVDLPESFESLGSTQSNFGRLQRAGVKVALAEIATDADRQPRNAKQSAGNLVALTRVPGADGVDWDHALAAVTSGPAEAMGMGRDFGSLRPGRRADVVVWDGDPLELSSAPALILIDGVEQPLETRQTRLRDRYRSLDREVLPPAYRR